MIKPLQNNVLLEIVEEEKKTSIILATAEEDTRPTRKGKIVAIGEKVSLPIKVGEVVLFRPFGFDDMEVDGKKYLIGQETNIFAKV